MLYSFLNSEYGDGDSRLVRRNHAVFDNNGERDSYDGVDYRAILGDYSR